MSAPSTQAAERTQLARVRTVVAVLLTSLIAARAALSIRPAAGLACLVVVPVAVATLRLRPPLSHLVLVAVVMALAAMGLVLAV